MCRVAVAAKGPEGVMAITDATAGAGLKQGSRTHLGGRQIEVGAQAAFLDDGTLAGDDRERKRACLELAAAPVARSVVNNDDTRQVKRRAIGGAYRGDTLHKLSFCIPVHDDDIHGDHELCRTRSQPAQRQDRVIAIVLGDELVGVERPCLGRSDGDGEI